MRRELDGGGFGITALYAHKLPAIDRAIRESNTDAKPLQQVTHTPSFLAKC